MMHFSVKIVFKTFEPITQETGLEMWKLGSHFQALSGRGGRTYQLKATGVSASLTDALSVLIAAIEQNIAKDKNGRNSVQITSIEAVAE